MDRRRHVERILFSFHVVCNSHRGSIVSTLTFWFYRSKIIIYYKPRTGLKLVGSRPT